MSIRTMAAAYILIMSATAFVFFGIDKWKAATHRWRIKESVLIGLCIMGGSIGGLGGMLLFHHKTRKPLFFVGIPLILIAQILILMLLYHRGF